MSRERGWEERGDAKEVENKPSVVGKSSSGLCRSNVETSFRERGVSGMPLSGGDLILIYSRVPNKLVFAVVTSALGRSRLQPPPRLRLTSSRFVQTYPEHHGLLTAARRRPGSCLLLSVPLTHLVLFLTLCCLRPCVAIPVTLTLIIIRLRIRQRTVRQREREREAVYTIVRRVFLVMLSILSCASPFDLRSGSPKRQRDSDVSVYRCRTVHCQGARVENQQQQEVVLKKRDSSPW